MVHADPAIDGADTADAPESDLAVARAATPRPIEEVAADLAGPDDEIEPRGDGVAKLTQSAVRSATASEPDGTTVLVTGMTPTPKGEGKTVTTVGLGQALAGLGESTAVAVREPSLGPVFGIRAAPRAAGTRRCFRWSRSTSTSPATSTRSRPRTTCFPAARQPPPSGE